MSTFPLRIGTPDGLLFEGNVERVICRTVSNTASTIVKITKIPAKYGMNSPNKKSNSVIFPKKISIGPKQNSMNESSPVTIRPVHNFFVFSFLFVPSFFFSILFSLSLSIILYAPFLIICNQYRHGIDNRERISGLILNLW